LSFLLEGLQKPVVLTGSQLPIGTIRTDAKENLITAIEIAAAKDERWSAHGARSGGVLRVQPHTGATAP
jgi:L-asparaginase/Glu-tRNA(Gln) amidotransferase subunit D